MTDYQQGATRRPTDYGSPLLGVEPEGRYQPLAVDAEGRLKSAPSDVPVQTSADTHAPAADTAAVITYAAPGVGLAHVIDGLVWSVSGDATSVAALTIADGATTVFQVQAGYPVGVQQVTFPSGLRASANAAMTLTLGAMGAAATGRINSIGHRVAVIDADARLGLLDFRQGSQSQYLPLF